MVEGLHLVVTGIMTRRRRAGVEESGLEPEQAVGKGLVEATTRFEVSPRASARDEDTRAAWSLPLPEAWKAAVEAELVMVGAAAATLIDLIHRMATGSPSGRHGHGALLHGASGTGKTAMVEEVMKRSGLPSLWVSGPSIFRVDRGEAEAYIRGLYAQARRVAVASGGRCCVLVIDDIDAVSRDRSQAANVTDLGLTAALLEDLDEEESHGRGVFTLGITNAPLTALDRSLLCPGRLEYIVHLEMPNQSERQAILERLLKQQQFPEPTSLEAVARQTQGFTPADLSWVVREALAMAAPHLKLEDLQDAVQRLRPHTLALGPPASSSGAAEGGVAVTFSDLSGIDEAIRLITTAILLPLREQGRLAVAAGAWGLPLPVPPLPSGVVLHGPPGTGKTKLMQALATECKPYAHFLPVECPEVINKLVGGSEQAIARLFESARAVAPCLIFLDHIEAVAGVRGHDTSTEHTMDRILSTLLVEMDGVSSGRGGVVVVAATNHLDALDPAILRPGRLDLHIKLPLPNSQAREAILRQHLRRVPVGGFHSGIGGGAEVVGSMEELMAWLVDSTEGFSGADLENVCREAATLSLREDLHNHHVAPRHFQQAVEGQKPLLPQAISGHRQDTDA